MVDETLSLHGRSDETRWGNLHTFQGAGALFVLAGGCERAGDQMKQDGATCIHSKAQGDFVCLGLLDVNARTIEARRDGATCMYFKAQGTLFASGCWMSRHRRSDETRWGCLHTFQGAVGLCLPRVAGCERTGDQMKQDGATCIHFKAH